MAVKRTLPLGEAYTTLHGVLEKGSDPSLGEIRGNPVKHIETVTRQNIRQDNGEDFIALIDGDYSVQTAELEVADNDFTTGTAEIVLGEYTLISNVDYLVGGTTGATATNIAAAIDNLPQYSAIAAGSVVEITREPPLERVDFFVRHNGSITNFTNLVPDARLMDSGSPDVSPPILT